MTDQPGVGAAPGRAERPREAPQPGEVQPGKAQPGTSTQSGYLAQPLGTFLDGLAAGTAAPAGGSAAALTVALAAALCAKTARLSARQLTAERADQLTTLAERIRGAAASLIDADARVYGEVIAQTRAAKSGHQNSGLAAALSAAADVPTQVVELGAEVAELATALAADANPALHGDAITAAVLAQSGAAAAATLVAINLADSPGDPRHQRTGLVLTAISRLVDQATTTSWRPV